MMRLARTTILLTLLLSANRLAEAGLYNDFNVQWTATISGDVSDLPAGITVTADNSYRNFPKPTMDMAGTGVVTLDSPFLGSAFAGVAIYSTDMYDGNVAGKVPNSDYGYATAMATGTGGALTFSNSTNSAITIQLTINYAVNMNTDYLGFGVAEGLYAINLVDTQSGLQSIHSDMLLNTTADHSFSNGVATKNITIPGKNDAGNGVDTVFLTGFTYGLAAVPEPRSLVLLGSGLAITLGLTRGRRRS